MKFWASSETYVDVSDSSEAIRSLVEPIISKRFLCGDIGSLNAKFRYISIIMPLSVIGRYPQRSKISPAGRVIDCCPSLDYEIFLKGDLRSRISEYVYGILGGHKLLNMAGASESQLRDFKNILNSTLGELSRYPVTS